MTAPGPQATVSRVMRVLQAVPVMLRARIDQARREGRALVRDAAVAAALALAAVVLLLLAVPLAVVAAILLLAEVMPAWAATAVVLGAVLVLGAAFLWAAGRRLRRRRFASWRGLREDVAELRRQLR